MKKLGVICAKMRHQGRIRYSDVENNDLPLDMMYCYTGRKKHS